MPNRVVNATRLSVVVLSFSGSALANDYPQEYVTRPQVVRERMIQVKGDIGLNFSNNSVLKPVRLAPSVEYGISDEVQIALRHENSLLINSRGDVYNGFGVEGQYLFLHEDAWSISALAGPHVVAFDPRFLLKARAGFGFWLLPTTSFAINAKLFTNIALTNRGDTTQGPVTIPGSRDDIVLAIQPSYNFDKSIAGFFNTGVVSTFQSFGDSWRIPLGAGALYSPDRAWDFGLAFTFPKIAGAKNSSTLDERELSFVVNWRGDL